MPSTPTISLLLFALAIIYFVRASRIGLLPLVLCQSGRYICERYPVALACHPNACLVLPPLLAASLSTLRTRSLVSRSLISSMVKQALDEQASSQMPLLRNFALHAGGANVIPDLTTSTLGLPAPSIFYRTLTSFTGLDCMDGHVNLPYVALEDTFHVGDCWEYNGAHGYLGVHLPEPVIISNFSIDHVAPRLLSAPARKRSPKDVVLWGLVTDPSSLETLHRSETRSPFIFSTTGKLPSYIKPGMDRFVKLATIHYNPSSASLRQYQPSAIDIPVQTVIIEILSNYGGPTTCLYYVGIHGANYE